MTFDEFNSIILMLMRMFVNQIYVMILRQDRQDDQFEWGKQEINVMSHTDLLSESLFLPFLS